MSSLKKFLKEKGYVKIPLIYTATQHLEIKARINKIEGNFILDTGASSSCVGFEAVSHFNLLAEESDIKAAGAGASDMLTQIAQKNSIEIKGWKKKKIDLVLFDLRHVNDALIKHKAERVHGIIGADILKKGKAIIDYKSMNLFLK